MGDNRKSVRCLELYSGIGGMRYAMKLAGIPHEIIAAIDVNPVVNCIYHQNFGNSNHFQKNIQSFTASELDKMNIDIITMSPPCQPFTRVGLKKDVDDARTCSFLHILSIIPELSKKPTYILLENVKGFEESLAHDVLIETLKKCGYNFQEYLLSPSDFGFPNSRLRYYIIAKLASLKFPLAIVNKVLSEIPDGASNWSEVCEKCRNNDLLEECHLKHFLEEKPDSYFKRFLVPDNILLKYAKVFDIVFESSSHSCCFTKALKVAPADYMPPWIIRRKLCYGRYSLGTGSIFTTSSDSEISEVFKKIESITDKSLELKLLKSLKLRYFTPREVANLMCFPSDFSVPPNVNEKQMYKALGNSINVFVVSCLLKLLLENV